jgi:hypothetical protein
MRAVFGVVSLLVALAIVGIVTVKQLKTVSGSVSSPPVAADGATSTPTSTEVREQSQQLQQRVKDDVTRALEQGAARSDETKP